jgi:hypothetical protein
MSAYNIHFVREGGTIENIKIIDCEITTAVNGISFDNTVDKLLIENNIYTATYWNNVINWCAEETLEYKFTNEVIYLPIDQRYGIKDMARIINILN